MNESDMKVVRRSIMFATISMCVLAGAACGILWAVGAWFVSILLLLPLSLMASNYERAMNDDQWLQEMYDKIEGGYR